MQELHSTFVPVNQIPSGLSLKYKLHPKLLEKHVLTDFLKALMASRLNPMIRSGDFFKDAVTSDGKLMLNGKPHGCFSFEADSIDPSKVVTMPF